MRINNEVLETEEERNHPDREPELTETSDLVHFSSLRDKKSQHFPKSLFIYEVIFCVNER